MLACGDETTPDGALGNEVGIGLGVGGGGNKIGEVGEVGGATSGFEGFVGTKLSGNGEKVDGAMMLVESSHGLEDFDMSLFVKIFGFDIF